MMMDGLPEAQTQPETVESRLRDLKIVLDDDIQYRLDLLFPRLTGWGSNGEIKRCARLIKTVEPFLKQILFDGEEVQHIAESTLFTLVATSIRLLMTTMAKSGRNADGMFWSIYYSEIETFDAGGWFGEPSLKLKDKKKLRLNGLGSGDVESMRAIFRDAIAEYRRLNVAPTVSQSREALCRRCYAVVPKDEFACTACGAEYWNPVDLAVRTLIFPVWGHYCMGHRWLAFAELMEYTGIWVYAIEILKIDVVGGLTRIAWILLFQHGVVAGITWFTCRDHLYLRTIPKISITADIQSNSE